MKAITSVLCLLLGVSTAQGITIDAFDLGGVLLVETGTGFTSTTQPGVGEIWTTRTTSMEIFSTPSPLTISTLFIDGGTFHFSLPAGVDGTAWVEWDGLMEDFIDESTVSIDFLFSDLGSDVTLILEDGGGLFHGVTVATPDGPSTTSFMLTDYAPHVDLTDITKVDLHLHGPLAGDYIIDEVRTAVPSPEPLTGSLGFIGLVGLLYATQRRRIN